MTSIHWLVWIIIGLTVVFTSRAVGGNIALFMWVGLAFLIIGIAKAVHQFVFTNREKPKQEAKQHITQQAHFVRCPRCMSVAPVNDNYCKICGTPLRAQPLRQVVR